jgi:hypothetical protein
MSGEAMAREATPGKLYKVKGTDWWKPEPNTPLNAGIPYVVQIAEDGFSLSQWRVFKWITAPENRLKNDTGVRGFVCDPGGYGHIAKQTGMCWKTVRNAIKAMEAKGAMRTHQKLMRGKQRQKTYYFATHWGDLLPSWRADEKLFHTAADPSRIVVQFRRKEFVTVEVAARMEMDPKRAPLRGSGRGRSEFAQEKEATVVAPAPEPLPSDADLAAIHEAFKNVAKSNLQDAIKLERAARAEARKLGNGDLHVAIIVQLLATIGQEYKPTPEYPIPTPKWVIDRMPAQVSWWVKHDSPLPDGLCRKCGGKGLVTTFTRGVGSTTKCECQYAARTG